MSSGERVRRTIRSVSLGCLIAASPIGASAQVPGMMVCQTPAFWCSFPGSAPNGLPCYCMTPYGSVPGYSINPVSVMQPPQQPQRPRTRPVPDTRRAEPADDEEIVLDEDSDACLNGLGDCRGSFRKAVQKSRDR